MGRWYGWSVALVSLLNASGVEIVATELVQPRAQIYIIVGSVRNTETGDRIAREIQRMAAQDKRVSIEIVRLKDYPLPFYTDPRPPRDRNDIAEDQQLKSWSAKIAEADGYIIVAPEYNAGYPAALKNALDSLYREWNNKPIAFIGYSGGPSGGSSMIQQLRHVAAGFRMIAVEAQITIPESWKAFTPHGALVADAAISARVSQILAQLVEAISRR